jgi:membrane fusion protein, multidrug efflux system
VIRPGAVAVAAALALVLGACSKGDDAGAGKKSEKAAAPVPVTVTAVTTKSVPVRLAAVGTVEASATVALKARIDGEITAVRFTDGAAVARGQVLFELDDRALRSRVAELRANVQRDRAMVANQRTREQRFRDLREKGFVSDDAWQQARTDRDAAEATLAANEAALAAAQVSLSYTRITAPVAGRIGRAVLQTGNAVKANDVTALAIINAVTPAYVNFPVPEQRLSDVRARLADGPLPVTATPTGGTGSVADGRLTFVDNSVDSATGTVRLRATFPNRDEALWPGQFARVSVTLREDPEAIVTPAESVQTGPKGTYVYVLKQDQTVELRPVKVARTDGPDAVIVSGVAPGEVVVVSGQLRLTPGARASPTRNGPPAKSP